MINNQNHNIQAYVYSCFDPAILGALLDFCNGRFGKGNYFWDADPGAVKNLVSPRKESDREFVLWKMEAAYKLHPFNAMILINHSNCGAYRLAGKTFDDPQKEESFHKQELEKAARVIEEKFPDIAVETHYFLKAKQRIAW